MSDTTFRSSEGRGSAFRPKASMTDSKETTGKDVNGGRLSSRRSDGDDHVDGEGMGSHRSRRSSSVESAKGKTERVVLRCSEMCHSSASRRRKWRDVYNDLLADLKQPIEKRPDKIGEGWEQDKDDAIIFDRYALFRFFWRSLFVRFDRKQIIRKPCVINIQQMRTR